MEKKVFFVEDNNPELSWEEQKQNKITEAVRDLCSTSVCTMSKSKCRKIVEKLVADLEERYKKEVLSVIPEEYPFLTKFGTGFNNCREQIIKEIKSLTK